MREKILFPLWLFSLFWLSLSLAGVSQSDGVIRGLVTLENTSLPLHNVSVMIRASRRSVETGADGRYEFTQVPPGAYQVIAHMDRLPDAIRTATVTAGGVATVDFQFRLTAAPEQVTVTASGREQTAFEAFQSVSTMGSIDLAERSHMSLGEVLDHQPGVAKRSFGPGASRPVIRGFDGDRVLILQDGLRTGTLASTSGEHGETIDVLGLDKVEIVKGPATLLYGSNAIGGVVNAVTGHHQLHEHPHKGVRGYVTGVGGTTNNLGGGHGGIEYGTGNWLLWAGGGGQRIGDYQAPRLKVENSAARISDVTGGLGYFGEKAFISLGAGYDNARYGVPFTSEISSEEGDVHLTLRRTNLRLNTGFRQTGHWLDGFRLSLNHTDYEHKELEGENVGTVFDNRQFIYRGVFEQRRTGPLTGSFGIWGLHRDFKAQGEESLSPPVRQNAFAAFTLQELDFDRLRFQFGGRIEHNRYRPRADSSERSFTGFSGAAGVHLPLWKGGAFVVNYTHSYRAPALEELYNNGPHIGLVTFEIGNGDLRRERGDGVDFSLRHSDKRVRAEANVFYYSLKDFVFLAPTGRMREGLPEARYRQADSRFIGTELQLDLGVHPILWVIMGFDAVNAELKQSGQPLPRIPPRRGRFGLDFQRSGWRVNPEALMVSEQSRVFGAEKRTPGYAVFNLRVSYTLAQQHLAHVFSAELFNPAGRLYRNHLSFIKEFAPEIGRGARFTYTMRFF